MILDEKISTAVKAMIDKKCFDIQLLDVSEITQIAERFIICQVKNRSQSQAVADEIMEKIDDQPFRVEGYQIGGWILMDYGDLIIHVFLPEEDEYYKLSRLWKDARFTRFDENGNPYESEYLEA